MSQILVLLYWLVGAAHLAAILLDQQTLRFITKPLLMPLLIAWYFLETKGRRTAVHVIMMVGFVFSCAGDVFLMSEEYFLPGLVSFLITHLLYIISFRKEINATRAPGEKLLLHKKPFLLIPLVGVAALLVGLVYNRIEPAMRIPVIVYSTVITVMVTWAINRHGKVSQQSWQLVLVGALVFMLSDSLIALNKFYFNGTLFQASFFIMLTYITGQFLIAKGTVKTT